MTTADVGRSAALAAEAAGLRASFGPGRNLPFSCKQLNAIDKRIAEGVLSGLKARSEATISPGVTSLFSTRRFWACGAMATQRRKARFTRASIGRL